MKKILEIIKTILIIGVLTLVALCAFGGGCMIYVVICLLFGIDGVNPTTALITAVIPAPFAWWIAPKLSDKWL